MARVTLTEAAVAEASAPKSGRVDLWDTELPGFGLRISETGRKSWQLMYRMDGRKRRMTLGSYPALPLELARDTAFDALRDVRRGRDPASERAAMTGGTMTFEAFAQAYIERYARPIKKSWATDAAMIEQDLLPAWRKRPVDGITRRDVLEVLERVVRRGHPTGANRRLALIRKMFLWGVEMDMVPATPVVAIKPPSPERPRDRVLSEAELATLWGSWDRIGMPFGPLCKLMVLTAQRRSVVAHLRLADIALADQLWTPPSELSRSGEPLEVPLPAFAIEIVTSLTRHDSVFVFPARGHHDRPVSGFSAAAKRISESAEIDAWRFDDLRRTALAGMVRLGVPADTIAAIANRRPAHPELVSGGDRAVEIDAKRSALDAWSEQVRGIVGA